MPWMPIVANDTWLARTKADAAASAAGKLCSGRGISSVQLPYEFYLKEKDCRGGGGEGAWLDRRQECVNQRTPRCRCFPGYTGAQCEVEMAQERVVPAFERQGW